jgi:hypothetical protein
MSFKLRSKPAPALLLRYKHLPVIAAHSSSLLPAPVMIMYLHAYLNRHVHLHLVIVIPAFSSHRHHLPLLLLVPQPFAALKRLL